MGIEGDYNWDVRKNKCDEEENHMSMVSSVIGYDFDGVLCNVIPAIQQHWKEKYEITLKEDRIRKFHIDFGEEYSTKKVAEDMKEAISLYQPYMYPFAYAMELVREISNKLNQVPIIITARAKETEEITRAWLNHWLSYPFDLVMVDSFKDKAKEIVNSPGMKFYVEDRLKICNSVAPVCEKVYMQRRLWNQGRELAHDNIMEINNLIEVYNDLFSVKEE